MVVKEFRQMRRDRVTFAIMVGIPILQLILFGFAINSDPKHLPTAVICPDTSVFTRSILAAMRNSAYFDVVAKPDTEAEASRMLTMGEVLFVVNFPTDFSRNLVRGDRPALLLQADATDPMAVSNAVGALKMLANSALNRDLAGSLSFLRTAATPVEVDVHPKYNPEGITQYNIVPGLMGVVLTMTLVIITSLAVTRERERGTMENLLTTPIRPLEVMLGKLIPYIMVGYLQMLLIVVAAHLLFQVPLLGSLSLLFAVSLLFIGANLSVGVTFSTVAKNQLQAVQMSFFFFLPSILLSGFMFPFRGMPEWAQWIGTALPLTHYLRVVRGILLKGNGVEDIWIHLWPILLFLVVVLTIGLKRYRQTLD